ncbi:MAG: iron-containing alcohol dehydrogenase [Bacteroidales bacterium]|nr:iron-containing alcohol dehydrogenase [Bacteroidales bacterium]
MNNFVFQNPTKLIFGKGEIKRLSKLIDKDKKILMTYGGGSIKRNGVYEQVMQALEGYDIVEFSGIEANPDYSTLMKAVDICKTQNIDFILAVGGGSIIDGTKFIATAAKFEGEDAWDILRKKAKNLPIPIDFATVLTLPATASEMNNGAVISRRDRQEKLAFHNPEGYPKFSILDPDVVLSLPEKQISNGIVDIYAHTLEQYLTTCLDTKVMDRWAEGLLLTLIEEAPKLLKPNPSYESCANFMLTATMGLNGFISMGVDEDWATHMIGHELTALCGLDHGETLAIVHPGVMDIMRKEKHGKLLQYARRVWNITIENEEQAIDMAIEKTENFFRSIGKKTRLSEYGIGNDVIDTIVQRFTDRGWAVGEHGIVTPEKTRLILEKVL